jgi:hypothetical protein
MMWFTAALGLLSKIGPAITGIDFNSIYNVIKDIFSNIIKYWYYWAVGALVALNVFTGYELKHAKDALTKEVAAHVKDIQDFKTAQATANSNALTIQTNLAKESKASANQADADYSSLLSKYRSNLLRFEASKGGAGQPGDNQLPTAQGSDGPSTSSQFPQGLTISGADADICTVNTARLQAVHDWATNLQKDSVPQ